MAKGKQGVGQFRGDGKLYSHRGRKCWTVDEFMGHKAFQADRKRRLELKRDKRGRG
jgi:hypothetical protein